MTLAASTIYPNAFWSPLDNPLISDWAINWLYLLNTFFASATGIKLLTRLVSGGGTGLAAFKPNAIVQSPRAIENCFNLGSFFIIASSLARKKYELLRIETTSRSS